MAGSAGIVMLISTWSFILMMNGKRGISMIYEIFVMVLWGIITIISLCKGFISLECGYIGMCIMLAAGLLHKEE